jgi:tetratricopeptide (TPR) repeat protein
MLKRIWQWLKGLFGRLFGVGTRSSHRSRQDTHSTRDDAPPSKPLEDSDYEYLFRQLLEGVMHSWQQDRVLRWFEALKGRTTYGEWVAWLNRFGERVLASPAPNNELAARLVQLGEMLLSIPSLREIGEAAYGIGMRLLDRNPGEPIWEYEGPDAPPLAPFQGEEQNNQEAAQPEAITLDELLVRMQEDVNLVQVIAQQLGIETTDPHLIIQEVINQLNAANQAATEEAESLFTQGNQQVEAGNLEGAIASFDKAIEFKPDSHDAWLNRGNTLVELGRIQEALASYDKALEFKPDDHEAWINRGNTLVELSRFEEAIASYDKALEFKPDYDDAWNNRGLALLNLGRSEEALASYDKAKEFKPDCYEAWYNRGIALVGLGRSEEAIASYDKALEIQPDSHQAWLNRGIVLRYIGRNEEAIASCDKAIEINPDSHEVWQIRGAVLYDSGNFEQALASFNKAIEIQADFHEAWHNRGLAQRRLGRLDEAGISFEKAQEIQAKKG